MCERERVRARIRDSERKNVYFCIFIRVCVCERVEKKFVCVIPKKSKQTPVTDIGNNGCDLDTLCLLEQSKKKKKESHNSHSKDSSNDGRDFGTLCAFEKKQKKTGK